MKHYSELNNTERHLVDEFISWCKSDAPIKYRLIKLDSLVKQLNKLNLFELAISMVN